jgi:hypothetical protein
MLTTSGFTGFTFAEHSSLPELKTIWIAGGYIHERWIKAKPFSVIKRLCSMGIIQLSTILKK